MDKEIDLLIKSLTKAIEMNDEETILKINEEVDTIISKLLPDENKLAQTEKESRERKEM